MKIPSRYLLSQPASASTLHLFKCSTLHVLILYSISEHMKSACAAWRMHASLSQKTAMVMLRFKKSGLNLAEIKKKLYRPIIQYQIILSRLRSWSSWSWLNSLATWLLMDCFQNMNPSSADIIPPRQLYLESFLTSTYSATDQDQVYLIALLDVSGAFNTVNHGILL